jgi:hypothetical protein
MSATLFFTACSTKEVYEPKNVVGTWENTKTLDAKIVDKTAKVAVLSDGKIVADDKKIALDIPKSYRVLGANKEYVLSTNIDGHLIIDDIQTKSRTEFDLKKTIATASTDGRVVAVVFAMGEMALYDLVSKEPLLKLDGTTSIAVDARIVQPYFMGDLVLFLTLDGKVVIVNKKLKKRLRTIVVSGAEYFNNIIYFDILNEKLIVATATKILSFGSSQQRVELEARNITHDTHHLYVATKQGDIISLDESLKQQAKVHFPFAHFLALRVSGDKVYALEKEGYLIVLSKDLLTYKIYEVDLEDDTYVYPMKDQFIIGDKALLLNNATSK